MSGGKTLIGGTAYTIAGGRTLVDGSAYSIAQGKVMKGGTVYTIDMPHENLVSTSVATDGTTIFNGVGYMDGMYLVPNGSGSMVPYHCHTDSTGKCFTTGWIYMPVGTKTIYFKGANWDTTNNMCRIAIYSTTNLGTAAISYDINATASSGANNDIAKYGTLTTLDTNYYKFVGNAATWDAYVMNKDRWIAFSLVGSGANFHVTFNQPIRD